MATSLLEKLEESAADKHDAAIESYVTIIRRADAPHPSDFKELSAACELLGITPAEAQADRSAVERVARLEAETVPAEKVAELRATRDRVHRETVAEIKKHICDAVNALGHDEADTRHVISMFQVIVPFTTQVPIEKDLHARRSAAEIDLIQAENSNAQNRQQIINAKRASVRMFPA